MSSHLRKPAACRRILALDCATNTGWAYHGGKGTRVRYGTRRIKGVYEAEKLADYDLWLRDMLYMYRPSVVWVEKPIFRGPNSKFLMGMNTMTLMACHAFDVRMEEAAPSTIKKSLTGSGRASKDDMIAAIKARGVTPGDDNQADAMALLLYATQKEAQR